MGLRLAAGMLLVALFIQGNHAQDASLMRRETKEDKDGQADVNIDSNGQMLKQKKEELRETELGGVKLAEAHEHNYYDLARKRAGDGEHTVDNTANYLCAEEGKNFETASLADTYFREECAVTYGYGKSLCDPLADKVFESWAQDMSAPWKPDDAQCTEITSLLQTDRSRRAELGLGSATAEAPSLVEASLSGGRALLSDRSVVLDKTLQGKSTKEDTDGGAAHRKWQRP